MQSMNIRKQAMNDIAKLHHSDLNEPVKHE